jgi:UDPglucose 6-dehydrogenase
MKIGIIGGGIVGQAVASAFNDKTDVILSDLNNGTSIDDICKAKVDIVFVCVPTPTIDGVFDDSIVVGVLGQLEENWTGVVCIKSTMLPDSLLAIDNKYRGLEIVHTPEFLTERNATEDFVNPDIIVIGSNNEQAARYVETIYTKFSTINVECLENLHTVDLVTASILKYGFNTFYATKITFMNELYNVLTKSGAKMSWDEFKVVYGSNPSIGTAHIDVPGHDGMMGFGGKCFPKDTKAFSTYARGLGEKMALLETVIDNNETYRNK